MPSLCSAVLALALLSAAGAQDFTELSPELELGSCQEEQEVAGARSDIECLVRASPGAQVAAFRADTGGCSRIPRCDLLTLSGSSAPRPQSTRIFLQPVRRLLFALKGGSGLGANASFASSAGCNSSLLLLPREHAPAVQLWRSCWLDRLPELARRLSLSSINLHVIKNGKDVMNITFNITFDGLNTWNWFAGSRVASYWPSTLNGIQAISSSGLFSIQGLRYYDGTTGALTGVRTFVVEVVYPGCPGDIGCLTVVEYSDSCAWAQGVNVPLPKILYNPDASRVWNGNVAAADYLAISV